MFVHYRAQGLIFKKEERGESDLLFSVYTKDFGRLEILGKAIRKISSKLRAGAEIFYLSEIEFIQGKTYKTLTDAILIDKFDNLRSDLTKIEIACDISEVLGKLIKGQETDEKTWQLLAETFRKLDNCQLPNCYLIYYYFFWNFVSFLGYGPRLDGEKNIFPETIKIVRMILERDWSALDKLKVGKKYFDNLEFVSDNYFSKIAEIYA